MIDRQLNYGRHLVERFLLQSLPYRSVLDIGAGSGIDLKLAKKVNPSAKLSAVEVYVPYAERLRSEDIQVYPLNIEHDRLPFANDELDVVIANQVLEHTKEIFWIFHEVTRVLRIGGRFIVGVPNLAALHNRLLLLLGKQPSPIKSHSAHVRGFTRNDLMNFVEASFPGGGYELKGFGGSNFYPFPPVLARPLAHILPNMAWGIFLLLEKKCAYSREFLDFPRREQLETNFWLGTE